MNKYIKKFQRYYSEFMYVPSSIYNILQEHKPEKIKIIHSKPSFKTSGLAYTIQFYYKNNFYEFYFQNEEEEFRDYTIDHAGIGLDWLFGSRVHGCGQFILYFNHEHVFNSRYDRFQKLKDVDSEFLLDDVERSNDKYWSEMRMRIEYQPPTKEDDPNNLFLTVVSDKISPLVWIADLLECESYLKTSLENTNHDNNPTGISSKNIQNEEDAIILIKKLLQKIV